MKRFLLFLTACSALYADNVLHPGTPVLDRPTLTVLGIQLPLTGDDNFNSSVSVQYRVSGTQTWQTALPLFRVHPETVAGYTVQPQFGGSIFDLKPATTYDIQLHAVDPDGVDKTWNLTGTTRAVPTDPAAPNAKMVTSAAALTSTLASAQPGDIITLANGTYNGTFHILNGGTAANPIVIRGASQDGVVLDGGNCTSCNIFEVYGGGYVHLEQMTMQNAERAIRFQTSNSYGNVVRRVHVKNTTWGIGGQPNQYDLYIADNILEGRLLWPHVYSDDNGAYSYYDGIAVFGFGHVVAHNRISGYGDAMKTEQDGARANDFYGNEVLFTYDNAIELDGSEGNTRCFRNRFTNTFSPISVQPVHGGPAYVMRNVVVNIVAEQLKFHALATTPAQEPSGILVYNNTFVSPPIPALYLQTPAASHYFEIENNIFLSPASEGPEAADWTGPIDHGTFDYNAYFPNGIFRFNVAALGGYFFEPNFAGLQSLGMEPHGFLATGTIFANGMTPPSTYATLLTPPDATLAANAVVVDKGRILPNVNDLYKGAGPDLGALELGCPEPTYGPRPAGTDESNEVTGCSVSNGTTTQSVTSVSVAPTTVTLGRSAGQQFTATTAPTSGGAVNWSIAPARGAITQAGLYTAPADALLGETVTVRAVSATATTVSGTGTVHLTAPVSGSLVPTTATVAPGKTQQFTATVLGAVDTSVTWILNPPVGTITSTGLYTAPASAAPQTIFVTAVSTADPTKTATSTLTISGSATPSVTITPGSVTLKPGGLQQFQATVSGLDNTGVFWTISPFVGQMSWTGLYQAPYSPGTTVTVTAYSMANYLVTGTAKITLTQ